MKAKSGHFVEELMVIKLFRCNYARDLIIKVKRNSIISSTRITRYGIKKLIQTKDYHKWKKKRKYGQRWMAKETAAFSSIKRMFGEYTSLLSGFKLVKEMAMKVSLYNLFRRIT